jgi:hypothetical protein
VGKWGSGEVGKWGSGEVGKWGSGENKAASCLLSTVSYCKVLLIFLGLGRFVKIDTELYVIYISG